MKLGIFGDVDVTTNTPQFGYGLGLGYNFAIMNQWQGEANLVYLGRGYKSSDNNIVTWNNIQVPIIVRKQLYPIVSLGAGLAFTNAIGDVTTTAEDGTATTAPIADAGFQAFDTGIVVSGRIHLNSFLVELRVTAGVTDLEAGAASKTTSSETQAIFGYLF